MAERGKSEPEEYATNLWLTVEAKAQTWPSDAQLRRLAEARLPLIVVDGAPDLDDAATTVGFARFLRDCGSRLIEVRWEASVASDLASALAHLAPPAGSDPVALAWRTGWHYGQFYWRAGPGFVVVKDARAGDDQARYVIEGEEMLAAFALLARVRHFEAIPAGLRASCEALTEAGLALRRGDWLTALPMALREWPIPDSSI